MAQRTYYTAKTADDKDPPAQAKKLGTKAYGYRTIAIALRYTPKGGYVEERHSWKDQDWSGRVVARKD